MTPRELVNAIQRVTPGKEPPAYCHGWAITARLVPERDEIEYTARLQVNLRFSVTGAAREYPGLLEQEFYIHAGDICDFDDGVRDLIEEQTRAIKKSRNDYGPDAEQ